MQILYCKGALTGYVSRMMPGARLSGFFSDRGWEKEAAVPQVQASTEAIKVSPSGPEHGSTPMEPCGTKAG